MTLTRRKTLALIGGGVVAAAATTAAGFVATRTPHRARAPWSEAGGYDDPRLDALSWAILAPNPHNLQPWAARLEGRDALTILRDPAKALPETDPFDRQITIGFGCFLELFSLAAAARGLNAEATLFPGGEAVAHIRLTPGALPDPLFAHAAARRSNKAAYEDRAVPDAAAAALSAHARIIRDAETVAALRDLTADALTVEMTTPRTMQESIDVMRLGKAEIEASPDGIDVGGAFFETLMAVGVLSRETMADPSSQAFQMGLKETVGKLRATPAYAAVIGPAGRAGEIEAGRRWLRLNLAATGLGLSLHPVSQCLQEYAEVAPHREAAHALLAPGGETVQMLGRLGYGPDAAPAPRWPLEAKLRHG